jgi:hypothetical protein
MFFSKKDCNNYSKYKRDGRLTQYYGHPLLKYITISNIILLCIIKSDLYKTSDITFPLINTSEKSLFYVANIFKLAEKNKLNIVKKRYNKDMFSLCFHKKENEINAKLNVYLTVLSLKNIKDKELIILSNMLIRNNKIHDIHGRYIHFYLYDKGIIPLPKDVKKVINNEKKIMMDKCGDNNYSYEKEYLLRYKIAKEMTNNFEKFEKALKELKIKAKKFIEKTKKSKDFKFFCENNPSVPFKLNFIELLKEAKQDYLITPELKKYLRSLK